MIIIIDHLDPVFNLQRTLVLGFLVDNLYFDSFFLGISLYLIGFLDHLTDLIHAFHCLQTCDIALQPAKQFDIGPPLFLHFLILRVLLFGVADLVLMILRELLNRLNHLGFLCLLHHSLGIQSALGLLIMLDEGIVSCDVLFQDVLHRLGVFHFDL